VRLNTEEALTECDETRNVENGVGIQIMELNLVSKEETSEERMRGGGAKALEGEKRERLPRSPQMAGYDFRAGGENLHQIIV
jgi:hypothetical protein